MADSLKVIGAGLGRTGTLSLKKALEQLGIGKCYHMVELLEHNEHIVEWEKSLKGQIPNWDAIFKGYRATVDYPGCIYYKELLEHYPDAKVILTVRDADSWYESNYATIFTARPKPHHILKLLSRLPFSLKARYLFRCGKYTKSLSIDGLFQGKTKRKHKDELIKIYHDFNAEVQATVPAERLLVFNVKEGWEPLCNFLEKPVPATEFPRSNLRADFEKDMIQNMFDL